VLVAGVRGAGVLAHGLLLAARDEQAHRQPHQRDEREPAEELRGGELGPEEDPQDDPELEDEVGRGEHERDRGGQPGALLERALADRDRRVGARRGRGAEPGRARRRGEAATAERALHLLAGDPCLDDPRQREAEDERPPDLPRHLERVAEAVAERAEHRRA
jgi:hypothetical protein